MKLYRQDRQRVQYFKTFDGVNRKVSFVLEQMQVNTVSPTSGVFFLFQQNRDAIVETVDKILPIIK